MSSLDSIIPKTYRTFKELEQAVEECAGADGFVVVKYNTSYIKEKVIQKGTFRCHKYANS